MKYSNEIKAEVIRRYRQEDSPTKISQDLGPNKATIWLWCKEARCAMSHKEAMHRETTRSLISQARKGNYKQPKEGYQIPTNELAYLVGVLMGDGYISTGVGLSTKDREFREAFCGAFEKQFGLPMSVYTIPAKRKKFPKGKYGNSSLMWAASASCTLITNFLLEIRNEQWVRKLSTQHKIEWLRGVWDSEGNVYKFKIHNSWQVRFASTERWLADLYSDVLYEIFGWKRRPSGPDGNGVWRVNTGRLEWVIYFYDIVKPTICRKRERFESAKVYWESKV